MPKNIVNLSGRRVLIPLDHPEFQTKKWGWMRQLIRTTELHPRTGAVGVTERRRGFPGVLTLLANAVIENLPDIIAAVPTVKNLLRKGAIKLEDAAPPPVEAPRVRIPNGKARKNEEAK